MSTSRLAANTATYVRSAMEVAIAMDITRVFALASGLLLNEEKTLVIALNPEAVPQAVSVSRYPGGQQSGSGIHVAIGAYSTCHVARIGSADAHDS